MIVDKLCEAAFLVGLVHFCTESVVEGKETRPVADKLGGRDDSLEVVIADNRIVHENA